MIKEIFEKTIKKIVENESKKLGNRENYVGASDVAQCTRKVVLSKLTDTEYDTNTLVKLEKGHLTEYLIEACFKETNYRWKAQPVFIHPEMKFLRAHPDFVFYTKDLKKLGILELKSTSNVPNEPYTGWLMQLQSQLGLAKMRYPNSAIKGVIFAIDLNSGEYKEFGPYEPDDTIFSHLLEKAKSIYEFVKNKKIDDLPIEEGLVCGTCPFKQSCPAFSSGKKELPDEMKRLVKEYAYLSEQEKSIKQKKDKIKDDLIKSLGETQTAFDGYKLTIKKASAKRVDTKILQNEYPEVYKAVLKETEYFMFRVT